MSQQPAHQQHRYQQQQLYRPLENDNTTVQVQTNSENSSVDALKKPLIDSVEEKKESESNQRALTISFLLMVVIGLGNKIFQVLQLQPMYNYPLFTSLLTTFIYLPASFAYIIPMIWYGSQISEESQQIPKYKFAIMGALDSIAGIMQTLSVNYIANGSLVILLTQAAIPFSMVISRYFLGTKYKTFQYIGAVVVAGGLLAVLLPTFINPPDDDGNGSNVPIWSLVLMFSCIPMCLSSVYKEKALGEVEIDPVYLNGWVAWFQFFVSLPLLLPSAPAVQISVADIPSNLWDGAKCFVGINTILTGAHIDDCTYAPTYTCIYMAFNLAYNVLIILILKYGSSNILWLAMTIMVPLGNVSFTLPFMPNNKSLKPTDIVGLIVIMTGLIMYRFWPKVYDLLLRMNCCVVPKAAKNPLGIDEIDDAPSTSMATPATAPPVGEAGETSEPSSSAFNQNSPVVGVQTPNLGGVHGARGHGPRLSNRA